MSDTQGEHKAGYARLPIPTLTELGSSSSRALGSEDGTSVESSNPLWKPDRTSSYHGRNTSSARIPKLARVQSPPVVYCPDNCSLKSYVSPLSCEPPAFSSGVEADVASAEYAWEALGNSQTRILRLHAGIFGTELRGTLFVADLEPEKYTARDSQGITVDFIALSYVWGTPDYYNHIHVGGHNIPLRRNLYAALQHIRSPVGDRHIWIDALSINQFNDLEKSHQVGRMSTIYRSALMTVAWLGEAGPHTALAMGTFRDMPQQRVLHQPECLSNLHYLQEGALDLFTRPWLRRVWVRREVWASRRIIVACGAQRLTWSRFVRGRSLCFTALSSSGQNHLDTLARLAQEYPTELAMRKLTMRTFGIRKTDQKQYTDDEIGHLPLDVVNVLRAGAECESSDPRDHVYALLDMTSAPVRYISSSATSVASANFPEARPHIVIDYSKTVGEVFTDIARYVVGTDRSPKLLYLTASQRAFERRGQLDLPSWVPDWSAASAFGPWLDFIEVVAREVGNLQLHGPEDRWRSPHWTKDTYGNPRCQDLAIRESTLYCFGYSIGLLCMQHELPNSMQMTVTQANAARKYYSDLRTVYLTQVRTELSTQLKDHRLNIPPGRRDQWLVPVTMNPCVLVYLEGCLLPVVLEEDYLDSQAPYRFAGFAISRDSLDMNPPPVADRNYINGKGRDPRLAVYRECYEELRSGSCTKRSTWAIK